MCGEIIRNKRNRNTCDDNSCKADCFKRNKQTRGACEGFGNRAKLCTCHPPHCPPRRWIIIYIETRIIFIIILCLCYRIQIKQIFILFSIRSLTQQLQNYIQPPCACFYMYKNKMIKRANPRVWAAKKRKALSLESLLLSSERFLRRASWALRRWRALGVTAGIVFSVCF